jgi:hypothetical protein
VYFSVEPGIGEERVPRQQHDRDLAGEPIGGHVKRHQRAPRQEVQRAGAASGGHGRWSERSR